MIWSDCHDPKPDATEERKYSPHPCAKCGAFKVRVILEDEADGRGTYDDIKCLACGHHYKTDGPDA